MEQRSLNYLLAFDFALEELAGIQLLAGRPFATDQALLAVRASHFHCGPIARLAEDWFRARGIAGARFHSLDGHYVLRDEETGLLFDLEAVGGRSDATLLPIYERTIEMGRLMSKGGYQKGKVDNLFDRYAESLRLARSQLIGLL